MATRISAGGRVTQADAVPVEPVAWPQRVLSGTRDLRIQQVRPLIPPAILIEEIPVSGPASALVTETRSAITDAIYGRDSRLIVVVGPCSIHDTHAALEFGSWLARMRQRYAESLILVMRTYFEKPRTAVGWKGLINDPDLDETFHINKGLRLTRQLLLALNEMGVPTGSEFLDTQIPQHIADLTSWASIGARTTESQIHRELASGLSMPVGFKNNVDGSTQSAVDAVVSARTEHWFPGMTTQAVAAIFQTTGNDACHVILRGGSRSGPNYHREDVTLVAQQLVSRGLPDRVMVDCSHGNSLKDHRRQPAVLEAVAEQVSSGSPHILGLMLESHLVEGRQDYVPGLPAVYGQSITDSCLSIEQTESLLAQAAAAQCARARSNVR